LRASLHRRDLYRFADAIITGKANLTTAVLVIIRIFIARWPPVNAYIGQEYHNVFMSN